MNNKKDFEKIKIIYQDDNVVALFKPKNILVHGSGKKNEKIGLTLVDYIVKEFPEINGVGEPIMSNEEIMIDRPGIVHRLDKDTSGIILVAKNQEYFENLKKQFKDRVVQKNYRLFAYGKFIFDKKGVDTPIGRSKNDFRK
jgi:23S rRNA pseudouridine1911/1915/1917 synthase